MIVVDRLAWQKFDQAPIERVELVDFCLLSFARWLQQTFPFGIEPKR
jgi:hypothetical protein